MLFCFLGENNLVYETISWNMNVFMKVTEKLQESYTNHFVCIAKNAFWYKLNQLYVKLL
jgi:hypothetical protein